MVKNYQEEKKMDQSKKYPRFFKPFMPQTSSKRCRIPNSFIAHIDKELPNMAVLRNRLGRLWPVEVAKTDDTVCFQNGWEQFVEASSLVFGEFMTFCYDGEYTFDVLLFDKSGCEKENVMASASSDRRTTFTEREDGDDDDVKEEDDDNEDEEVYDDEEEDSVYEEEEEVDTFDDDEEKELYIVDDGEEEKPEAYGRGGQNKASGHYGATLRDKIEKLDKVNAGMFVQPGNPYFMTTLSSGKQSNFRQLYVPTELLADFAIQLPQKMVFRSRSGKEWPGKLAVWKDGRSWIAGWHVFCKHNQVTKTDICICEFVRGKPNLIQVHIHRP